MKSLKKLLVAMSLTALSGPALASNVDRLVSKLDDLALASIDEWKVSGDIATSKLEGDGYAQPGFDDGGWQTLRLGQRLDVDSCWIRKRVVLPRFVLGEPVRGPVRLRLTVDDLGHLWVNGQSRGRFDWDGEFELAKDSEPGDAFVIAIKAVNTGGPLRLIRARLLLEGARELEIPVADLALSLRVAQKLLSFDTYQTSATNKVDPAIDRSKLDPDRRRRLDELLQGLAARLDTAALERGDRASFKASLADLRSKLGPIRDLAREFTLFFDANAHIDAAWLWREKETVQVVRNTFSSVLNMFRARPDFTYTQSSAAYYDWMERLHPDLFRAVQEKVRVRRWETIGGTWIEPDCNLPAGTSWARQLLYGQRYFREKLGKTVTIGWNPDSFGYNWNMPQLFRNAGIDTFVTQKIGWNDTNVFPHRLFWWEGPDESRVLTVFPFDYVNTVEDPYRLVDWLRQFEANTGFRKLLVLFGVGDHGGGPSLEMIDRVERLKSLDVFPAIEYGTAGRYVEWLRAQGLDDLPVWRDELYLEYHQGTFTTQADTKRANRESETLLVNAEKFATFAQLVGRPYPAADLVSAWKNVMFNQFHDILPGSSIREVYLDAAERYREVQTVGGFHLRKSLEALSGRIDTSDVRKGRPLIVFNPLSWERRDVARCRLELGDEAEYAIFDTAGREVPSQIVRIGPLLREVMFIAEAVPALGYAVYELRPGTSSVTSDAVRITERTLENENLSVEIDTATGWVRSIWDKRAGREALSASGNELQLLEDRPKAWDAWNVGWTGTRFSSTFRKAEIIELGPVRVVLRIRHDFLKPGVKKEYPTEDFPTSFFTQDVILYAGSDKVDFVTKIDWWEEKTMLKVAFPASVAAPAASYEIPYGSIQRSTGVLESWDRAKIEVPAQRWADLSDADYGVSLINNSKYGYDIKGSTIRLSLLRSPVWPDPTADRGEHTVEYALYPHAGGWRSARTVQRGLEFNTPLLVLEADRHHGTLPSRRPFVTLSPSNLVLASIKKAEDSEAWVIQWYDAVGRDATAEITLPFVPERAVMSDFLEGDGEPLAFSGRALRVGSPRNKVVTVKVWAKGAF
jgi:alpha-mannosidase